MAADTNGLKTFDDLDAALAEAGGGSARKCDRCRQQVGTINASLSVRTPPAGKGQRVGGSAVAPAIKARLCESCAVQIYSVVAKAVGRL